MNNTQQIEPIQDVKSFDSFDISLVRINVPSPESYATILVSLHSSQDSSLIKQITVECTKEELDPWGADDSIVYTIVANKLGFTLA